MAPGRSRPGPLAAVASLAVLGLAAYSNAFGAGFVFDDRPSILEYEPIRDVWGFLQVAHRPNRFIGYLSFAVNHAVGGFDPFGYHAVNVAIHLVNAALVFLLVRLAFRTPVLRESAVAPSSTAIAWLAAALFVAHPLQTGAVTYVVQRLTSLATTFYLAATVQYLAWRLRPPGTPRWATALRWALVLGTVLLAMRTKELSITLPVAILLAERAFFGPLGKERWLALAPLLATVLVIPLSAMGAVGVQGDSVLNRFEAASRAQSGTSRWEYATTQLAVVATYLRLLVLPVGQNLDHDFPVYRSLLAPRVLASAALLAGLGGGALFLFLRRGLDPAARLVAFGVGWFFLGLAVESSILPIADVIMEHRVYLPSAGIFASVATAAVWLAHRRAPSRGPRAVVVAGALVALALAVATHRRNAVWADEVTLWSDVVAKSPAKARGYNSLGAALGDAGRHEEGVRALEMAIRLDPEDPRPYYNLGRAMLLQRAYDRAAALFVRALELQGDWAAPYVNLAGALNLMRRYDDTIQLLVGAGEVVRDHPEARFNLAVAYVATGRQEEAEVEMRTLLRVSPPLAQQLQAFMAR